MSARNDFSAKNLSTVKNPFAGGNPAARAEAVRAMLIAAVVTIVVNQIPYLRFLTYPLRLLVTFIHEGSHALMGLLVGGSVRSISIQPNGSGLTESLLPMLPMGWLPQVLTSSAGYLGASLYGALMIGLLRRGVSGTKLLMTTGILVGIVTLGVFKGLIFTGNVFGLFWGIAIAAGLVFAALKLPRGAAAWGAAFVGVNCVLNALFDLQTLFTLSVSSGTATDAQSMFRLTALPAPVWAVAWIGLSFAMLWLVLRPGKANR